MGIPDEVVAARIEANADAVDFEVWPENWDTVEAFTFVCTQWRTESIGGGLAPGRVYWLGLDYAAAAMGLDKAGLPNPPDVWRGIRVMEAAARNALNGIEDTD